MSAKLSSSKIDMLAALLLRVFGRQRHRACTPCSSQSRRQHAELHHFCREMTGQSESQDRLA
jgi:hypothetical protein